MTYDPFSFILPSMLMTANTTASLQQGLRRGFLMLQREKYLSSSLALLTVVMVMMQLLLAGLLAVEGVHRLLISQASIHLEVLDGARDQDIQDFYAQVQQLPYVDEAEYLTREEAFERERERDPDLVAFLEQYNLENPFNDAFSITLASLDDYGAFTDFIEREEWRSVIDISFLTNVTDQERQARLLLDVTGAIRSLAYLFLFVASVLLLFVVLELVRRRANTRKSELMLESVLGASPQAVLLPFVTEMSALLILSLAAATVFVLVFLSMLPFMHSALAQGGAFAPLTSIVRSLLATVFPLMFVLEVLLMPVFALAGTLMGVRYRDLWPSAKK